MNSLKESNGAPTARSDVARDGMRDGLRSASSMAAECP
ncbi:MAG: hypothetical protein AVDCRST_MAG93-7431 [uncultured Chloroflexia bacterium]|uniref:Uncharacterized protein n=1 Tax=uncultured Chloroflexia bacterium TaxID=1672391 RepID=A0A6J4MEV6_9CHLR|nr:MAG: hypothetical protein AVDCRST_MAG93-7431 [uncultured Chloroflexia bacterium]